MFFSPKQNKRHPTVATRSQVRLHNKKKTYSLQTCAMQKHWVLTYFLKRETRELEVIERRPFCRDEYGPQKGRLYIQQGDSSWVLLGTGVLGDSLGALGHRMLCQFTRQQEPHSCLDLPTRDGRALVVVSQPRRLCCDALEDVVHEAVHDRHGLAGHSGVGMDLFEHLVDVDAEALLPLAPLLLLVGGTHIFLCLARLLHCFSARLGGILARLVFGRRSTLLLAKRWRNNNWGNLKFSFYRFSQHSEKCAPIGQHSRARETVRCDWSTPKIKLRDWLLREPMSKQLKLQFFGRGFWERSAMKQRQCKAKTRSCSAPKRRGLALPLIFCFSMR